MSVWRVVITDSESASGVAQICPNTATNHLVEDFDGAPQPGWRADEHGVYDCCPQPHIECWSENNAKALAAALTAAAAEPCS